MNSETTEGWKFVLLTVEQKKSKFLMVAGTLTSS